jgi:hypothetical protein
VRVIHGDGEDRQTMPVGGSMSSEDALKLSGHVQLNEDDVAYLMNLLRNATQPISTQQLIDALRRQSTQFHTTALNQDGEAASS